MSDPLPSPVARPLHVLTVPAWFPTPRDRMGGNFVETYIRSFQSAGMRVGVVFPDLIHRREWPSPILRHLLPQVVEEHVDGIPVIRISGPHTSFGQPLLQLWRYGCWLRRGFQSYRRRAGVPDVIHAHCAIPAGWCAVQLGARWRRPVLITEHTGPFALAMRPPAARRFTLAALRRANAVIAVSQVLATHMRHAGVRRGVHVVPNPVGSVFAYVPAPTTTRRDDGRTSYRVAFVGRLVREKGVFELAQAAVLVESDAAIHVEWHVVGDGPAAAELRRLIPQARFYGLQDAAGVRRVMVDSHLVVLPSHWENCPLVITEALACGRPVVATRDTGCAELVQAEDGLLHTIGDAAELARQIHSALFAYNRWNHAAIAQRAARRFSGAAISNRYGELFAAVRSRYSADRPAAATDGPLS